MSDPIESAKDTISPANIRFYDSIQPPLPAGTYTLEVTQTIHGVEKSGDPPQYTAAQAFQILAPQFCLDPATIHSVYPPAGQTGNYVNSLPFIVFNQFALPWSRTVVPGAGVQESNPAPWMGILLAYEQDMTGDNPKVGYVDAATSKWVGPETRTVASVTNPGSGMVGPVITDKDISGQPTDNVTVLRMQLAWFRAVAPTLEELTLLGHGRGVNTDNKVMLGMDADGKFAVVVGNRIPPQGGGRCTAFLISFEGLQSYIPGAQTPYQGTAENLQVVVLGSWSFTASDAVGSFVQLMAEIPNKGGVKLLQAAVDATSITDATAKEALEIGYVPLANELRIGEKTTSWYRGPGSAVPTQRDTINAPYTFSDHSIHYDPESGLFDLSCAAAWQIGRLLALSDGPFAASLGRWRDSYHHQQASKSEAATVNAKLQPALNVDAVATATANVTTTPSAVTHLRGLMAAMAQADTPLFPQVSMRSPLSSSTRPASVEAHAAASTGDPVLDLWQRIRGGQ